MSKDGQGACPNDELGFLLRLCAVMFKEGSEIAHTLGSVLLEMGADEFHESRLTKLGT